MGVAGGVDHLEAVTPAPEEAYGAPPAPGMVADVDSHLLLVCHHGLSLSLSLSLSLLWSSTANLTAADESAMKDAAARAGMRRLIHRSA